MIKNILKTNLLIIKLVIPFYLLADILIYFGVLQKISFLFEPITKIIGLPPETALSLASGILFELYPAIAFAAPLNLTPYEWTKLGLFLGILHALPVENAIMKKLGFSIFYSTILRIFVAFIAVGIFSILPISLDDPNITKSIDLPQYSNFQDMLLSSVINATILTIKIVTLITLLLILMDLIKAKISKVKINSFFALFSGLLLGITYGAGILLNEKEKLTDKELFFIGTFLLISHSLIEDPALFIIFGANLWALISIRLVLSITLASLFTFFYFYKKTKN